MVVLIDTNVLIDYLETKKKYKCGFLACLVKEFCI